MGSVGVAGPIVRRGVRLVRSFRVVLLRDLELDARTTAAAARADAAVEHGAETMPPDYAALARLPLRAEADESGPTPTI